MPLSKNLFEIDINFLRSASVNLNGINASDEELDVLQNTMDNGDGMNLDEINSVNSTPSDNEAGSNNSVTSINFSGNVSEI